ncbi:unnamed protein product [Linum trigynum]|uniref:Uncharacterized protein n=1 Tax=Linum trigynum TaxID=586398 RepID=A0AAV2FCX2_9ROSI
MESRNGSTTPRSYHHRNQQQQREEGMLSCWGRFKLNFFPWRRRPTLGGSTAANSPPIGITAASCGNFFGALWRSGSRYRRRSPTTAAGSGFRYDPIEYAQNFDDGNWEDDSEAGFNRGFSSRLAPSPSNSSSTRPLHDK